MEKRANAAYILTKVKQRRPGTDMRRLTTGIRCEKSVVRRFRRCEKVIECTDTNIDSIVGREKNQQDATIRCLLLTSISTCFEHNYGHLQENKEPVTAFDVLFCCPVLLS